MSDGIQAFIFQGIADHLKMSAPGLAEPARFAIARSLSIKLGSKLEAQHAALAQEIERWKLSAHSMANVQLSEENDALIERIGVLERQIERLQDLGERAAINTKLRGRAEAAEACVREIIARQAKAERE